MVEEPEEITIATLSPPRVEEEPEPELEEEAELVGEGEEATEAEEGAEPEGEGEAAAEGEGGGDESARGVAAVAVSPPAAAPGTRARCAARRRPDRRPRQPGRSLRRRPATTSASRSPTSSRRRWELPRARKRFGGLIAEGRTGPGGPRVAVLLPQTYMNERARRPGRRAASSACRSTGGRRSTTRSTCPSARCARKLGGGLAGHNGLKSLGAGARRQGLLAGPRRASADPTAPTPRSSPPTCSRRFREPREEDRRADRCRRRRGRAPGRADRRRGEEPGGDGLRAADQLRGRREAGGPAAPGAREGPQRDQHPDARGDARPPGAAREDDGAVRVLVISSNDHLGLSAGADVREELGRGGRVRRMELFAELYDELTRSRSRPSPPATARWSGAARRSRWPATCASGGSNLRMRFPGAELGVPVGPARLVTLCGLATAKYLLLTSRNVSADEALRMGLVHRVAPAAAHRGGGARARGRGRGAPARGGRPPEADAAPLGRGGGALRRRGPRPGRVAARRPGLAITKLIV